MAAAYAAPSALARLLVSQLYPSRNRHELRDFVHDRSQRAALSGSQEPLTIEKERKYIRVDSSATTELTPSCTTGLELDTKSLCKRIQELAVCASLAVAIGTLQRARVISYTLVPLLQRARARLGTQYNRFLQHADRIHPRGHQQA
eukprot:2395863-Prymnesium_polylepis.1